jgi:hypothetical protein
MPTLDPNVEEIRVLNSENNTHYYLYVRRDRIRAFYDFIVADRQTVPSAQIAMPGLSGTAIAGLDAIFDRRPLKFPAQDLLVWFRTAQKDYLGEYPNPTITVQEIEKALERFSSVYPPDVAARA